MDETLSIYLIRVKGSSYYTHAQFFLNSIHGFGLVWKEKLFEGDMRRSREEVL